MFWFSVVLVLNSDTILINESMHALKDVQCTNMSNNLYHYGDQMRHCMFHTCVQFQSTSVSSFHLMIECTDSLLYYASLKFRHFSFSTIICEVMYPDNSPPGQFPSVQFNIHEYTLYIFLYVLLNHRHNQNINK